MASGVAITRRLIQTTVSFDRDLWRVVEAAAARAGVDVAGYITMAATLRAIADTANAVEAAPASGTGRALSPVDSQPAARARLRGEWARRTAAEIGCESEAVKAEAGQALRRAKAVLDGIASRPSRDSERWEAVFRIAPDWCSAQPVCANAHDERARTEFGRWLEAVHPEDRSRVAGAIQEAIDRRDVVEVEHRLECGDGLVRWVYTRAVPLPHGDGPISEWLCAASEVAGPARGA